MRVLQRAALVQIEVLDVFQNKGWSRGGVGQLHVNEVGALHVFELNGGTQVFLHVFHLNVLHGQAFHMAIEKAMGCSQEEQRCQPWPRRLRHQSASGNRGEGTSLLSSNLPLYTAVGKQNNFYLLMVLRCT